MFEINCAFRLYCFLWKSKVNTQGNRGFLLYSLGKFEEGRACMNKIAKMFSLGKMVARGLHTHA